MAVGTQGAYISGMSTTVAIPIWNDQVSTTFDFSEKILIVETESGREIERREIEIGKKSAAAKAEELKRENAEVLLCGAISQPLAQAVSRAGVQIVPFVSGAIDSVLAAYLCGRLAEPCFLQPGCRPGARRRWRHGRGCRRGNSGYNQI